MSVSIIPLREDHLPQAERIFRVAFGTFLGLPDPTQFAADQDYVRARFRAPHVAAFAAERDGELVGSNFVTRWGSTGFFGPITVRPDLQGQGIAKALLEPAVAQFDAWGTTCATLFTFPHSPKHVGLYRSFGFHPRFLTPLMAGPPRAGAAPRRFGALDTEDRAIALADCRRVADAAWPGLDLTAEIETTQALGLGETVLVDGGFAVCHHGPRSEAGAGNLYLKFAAATDAAAFARLLDAAESLAAALGLSTVLAGVNTAREEAWAGLVSRGWRTVFQGVAMHRGNVAGTCRPGCYVLDDWR